MARLELRCERNVAVSPHRPSPQVAPGNHETYSDPSLTAFKVRFAGMPFPPAALVRGAARCMGTREFGAGDRVSTTTRYPSLHPSAPMV